MGNQVITNSRSTVDYIYLGLMTTNISYTFAVTAYAHRTSHDTDNSRQEIVRCEEV